MTNITKLKDQEQFSFTLNVLSFLGFDFHNSDTLLFVHQYDNVKELPHIQLSRPCTYSIQLEFTKSDKHYGTHHANVTFRSFDSTCRRTGRKINNYVIDKFESQTLDTSTLHEDLQSNFMYLVTEEYFFYTIDLEN